jgi:hypothetical protein
MEPWLQAEIRIRREDVLKNAQRARSLERAKGATKRVRLRIASGAQAVSDVFAGLAHRLRNGEIG